MNKKSLIILIIILLIMGFGFGAYLMTKPEAGPSELKVESLPAE